MEERQALAGSVQLQVFKKKKHQLCALEHVHIYKYTQYTSETTVGEKGQPEH